MRQCAFADGSFDPERFRCGEWKEKREFKLNPSGTCSTQCLYCAAKESRKRYAKRAAKFHTVIKPTEKKCGGWCGLIKPSRDFSFARGNVIDGLECLCRCCRICEQRDRFYKLPFGTYYNMRKMQLQLGKCWCCGRTFPGGPGGWHFDHCHDTGKFRGWLCDTCNKLEGFLKKYPDVIQPAPKMKAYLERDPATWHIPPSSST